MSAIVINWAAGVEATAAVDRTIEVVGSEIIVVVAAAAASPVVVVVATIFAVLTTAAISRLL